MQSLETVFTEHPLPWRTADLERGNRESGFVLMPAKMDVIDGQGDSVARCTSEEAAELIVRVVNNRQQPELSW